MKRFLIMAVSALMAVGCFATKSTTPRQTSVKHTDWSRNAVLYEVNLRQYTPEGTIEAFSKHLPRLQKLGVDILWFMPVHPISELNRKGTLGSYYAVRDYKDINPEFGNLADFKALVKKAHEMGFKVIIDWVPNHSGCDNAWVTEHPEWYVKDKNGKMVGPYDWTDVYKFDYSNREMRNAMIDALKFWLTDVNIDGFRCDVAGEVPTDFWVETRKELNKVKDIFFLAEASKEELSFDSFDMCYNWPMKDLQNQIALTAGQNAYDVAKGKKDENKMPADIDKMVAHQAKTFAGDSYLLNMITNHDLNSWEGTEFERYGDGVRTFAVLTYTLPGMPLIYTGQEVGFNHAFEFFEKDQSPVWTANDHTAFYTKLNELKHSFTALNAGNGAPMVRYQTENPHAYVFSRSDKNGSVYVFLNFSNKNVKLEYTGKTPKAKNAKDFFNGSTEMPTELAPWEFRVFTVK